MKNTITDKVFHIEFGTMLVNLRSIALVALAAISVSASPAPVPEELIYKPYDNSTDAASRDFQYRFCSCPSHHEEASLMQNKILTVAVITVLVTRTRILQTARLRNLHYSLSL